MNNLLHLDIVKVKLRLVPGTQGVFECFAYAIERGPLVSKVHLLVQRTKKPQSGLFTHSYLLADVPNWIRTLIFKNAARVKQVKNARN